MAINEWDEWRSKVDKAIWGNGQPGLQQNLSKHREDFTEFKSTWQERERSKIMYDDRQAKKMNRLIALLIALTAIGSLIVGVLAYEHETHHAVFTSNSQMVNASNNTHAALPDVR